MASVILRVKDWAEHFETKDSKRLKKVSWIRLSIKLSGDQYAELLSGHPDGPKHFAAWIGILQVAANCEKRGVLMRENGNGPHTPLSLAFKTRIPADWFEGAIDRLIAIGWLEADGGEIGETSGGKAVESGGCRVHLGNLIPVESGDRGKIPQIHPDSDRERGEIPETHPEPTGHHGFYTGDVSDAYKELQLQGQLQEQPEAVYNSEAMPPEMPPSFPLQPSPDAGFEALVGISMAAGKKYSEPELMTACRVWVSLPLEDQIAAVRDYRTKVSNGTWSDAVYVPGIESYLRKQPWKAKGPGRMLPEVRAKTRGEIAQMQAAEKFLREG